ncbi:MAG TPA: helix-turn-helix domain-containing protein [Kofleriaceae bacterium]|nr:helix-turn-helix domain-containing protein [Kofleriaceae bacterium]
MLLDRGVTRLYPSHSGPLDGAEIRAWLGSAGPNTSDNTVSIEAQVERRYARALLECCDGNQSAAARQLGLSRNELARLLKA